MIFGKANIPTDVDVYKRQLLDSDLSMLNEDTIRDYRNYFKLYSPRPNLRGNDIADFCKRIGIADNEGHLNYGGLMCFGKEEWVRRYVPVSYTHLDVYKRQAIRVGMMISRRIPVRNSSG